VLSESVLVAPFSLCGFRTVRLWTTLIRCVWGGGRKARPGYPNWLKLTGVRSASLCIPLLLSQMEEQMAVDAINQTKAAQVECLFIQNSVESSELGLSWILDFLMQPWKAFSPPNSGFCFGLKSQSSVIVWMLKWPSLAYFVERWDDGAQRGCDFLVTRSDFLYQPSSLYVACGCRLHLMVSEFGSGFGLDWTWRSWLCCCAERLLCSIQSAMKLCIFNAFFLSQHR